MTPYDVITFDCYGTLIDWESGIARAFCEAAEAAGRSIPSADAIRAHGEVEPRVQAEVYRPYREVLAETAIRVAERIGWEISRAEAEFLPASLPSWEPFPDTNPALRRLADSGVTLGILSNVDDALLAATVRHFPVEFEILVTAEQVRSYKLAPNHFLAARERLEGRRWLHAAQSFFHDVAPAIALGLPVAWVNRKRETAGPGQSPLFETRELTALADRLTGA